MIFQHLIEEPEDIPVNVGNPVTTNTIIGHVGNSGTKYENTDITRGNHLHLGVIISGNNSTGANNVINPLMFYPDIEFTY